MSVMCLHFKGRREETQSLLDLLTLTVLWTLRGGWRGFLEEAAFGFKA